MVTKLESEPYILIIFHKSDFYFRGNSMIMSIDDKSNPLV